VILLLGSTQAINIRRESFSDDSNGLDLPLLEDGNDIQLEKDIEGAAAKFSTIANEDTGLIEQFET
tara:strand:- start:447 stop:644 length:198 start_codon:yes stop_codon:yes gene_type:complete